MPPTLEQPPPLSAQPGQPGPPPQPSLGGLAGQDQGNQQGDQSIQIVAQHLMEAEQALQAAAKIKPELSAIVDKFVNEVKPQAGQILFGSGQGQQPQPGMQPDLSSLLTSGASSLSNKP